MKVVGAAVQALQDLGNRAAIPHLRRAARIALDGRLAKRARRAADGLEKNEP